MGQLEEFRALSHSYGKDNYEDLHDLFLHLRWTKSGAFESKEFPSALHRLKHLEILDLQTAAKVIPDFAHELPHIETFWLDAPNIGTLTLSMPHWPNLATFGLTASRLERLEADFSGCKQLNALSIVQTQIRALKIGQLNIERLNLFGNTSLVVDWTAARLPRLIALNLGQTQVDRLPDLQGMFPQIAELNLEMTPISALPPSIMTWGSDLSINCKGSALLHLPDNLGGATNIRRLDIRDTPLAALLRSADVEAKMYSQSIKIMLKKIGKTCDVIS